MSKKVIVTDLQTGKEKICNTQTEAAEWINSIAGLKLNPSNILWGLQYQVPIGRKRFKVEKLLKEDQKKVTPPKTKHRKKDASGWEYWQYNFAPSVLIAETKTDFYDEDRFEEYRTKMKKYGCKIVYEEEKCKRHYTRMEIYKKFDDVDMLFEDKIDALQEILSQVEL